VAAHVKRQHALTLSALTGYRALFTKGGVKEGDTLFVPGAGSGVATYIVQFAKAAGARVIVSSRSEEKRKKSKEIGADRAIDTHSDWQEALKDERIDVVIDSVGAATFKRSLAVLKRGGRMVTFGATTEDHVTIDLRKFYYGQYQLLGSTMGSREELRALLILMTEHDIRPLVDKVFPLDDAAQAFEYLSQGGQFGKVALRISD
jgi:zinc-binding alcohol dehydrogenase/oxidoreductase